MSFRLERLGRRLRENLWLGPAIAAAFAIGLASFAYVVGNRYDADVSLDIEQSALVTLLSIFATSMLTVATFTLTAIASSANAVSTSTTPRASRYVLSDGRGQLVLSAFIAAFIYSVVGIFAVTAFSYGKFGRFVLFLGLIAVITLVLIAFVAWIDHVLKLGRQHVMIDRLQDLAIHSMRPDSVGTFGARRGEGDGGDDGLAVHPTAPGYVVAVDVEALQRLAEHLDAEVVLLTRPGEMVEPTQPFARVRGLDDERPTLDDEQLDDDAVVRCVRDTIETARQRQHDHDVRFNVINLSETADRALSPGVNDPGTAINVLFVLVCVFDRWAEVARDPATREVRFDRVVVPTLDADELVTDAFTAIARDGAGAVEVGVRLHKTLRALERMGVPELAIAARSMAELALELSDDALVSTAHRERLHAVA